MTRVVLIPAAGASSRMRGRDKLVELVDGQPVLGLIAERALDAADQVIVVLPKGPSARRDCLAGLPLKIVDCEAPELGMSASFRAGVAAIGSGGAVMILPADMPELTTGDLATVWEAFETQGANQIFQGASADGQPGHPVVFPSKYLPDLACISGDKGAREILKAQGTQLVPLPDQHALTDLDTPEDWEAWRQTVGKNVPGS